MRFFMQGGGCLWVGLSLIVACQGAGYQPKPPNACELRALLRDASPHDARLLLNLLFWSYQRSYSTLRTQAAAEKNLREQWNAWRSCADRRLNPKAGAARFRQHGAHSLFEQLEHEFHDVQTRYSAVVELATTARHYMYQPVFDFVAALREEARSQVRSVVQQHLAVMAQELEQQLFVQALALRSGTKGIISNFLNQLAVSSFGHLDASWRLSSDKLMIQFLVIQELFNSVWAAIETSRAAFYRAYFHAVHDVMRELKFPEVSFTNLVYLSSVDEQETYVLEIN